MEREFQCPSCGAANEVSNPGILMRVCDYCRTAIYWDKESALRAGRKSMDLPPSTRFKVGATGKIGATRFTVLGRLSYAHRKGTWDEWFIEIEDGRIKWLTEDEGELFIEEPVVLTSPVPPHSEMQPGMKIGLNDRVGVVEEIGEARCIGGEGQIPFEVEIGETYPYVDGAAVDGSFSFGLEYDSHTGTPTAYMGRILAANDTVAGPRDRDARLSKPAEAIRCASCGKPYEGPRVESTEMVVCSACGAGLELDEAQVRVVGKNIGQKPRFSFTVGTSLTLERIAYEVMGRLCYVERDEGIEYRSLEYALYNPDLGYLWLSEEEGHFTIGRPYHQRFVVPPVPVAKMKVKVGDEVFQIYESSTTTLQWVDGALPWTASVGERTRYTHLVKPPDYVDQEITGNEVELFRGRYVDQDEMRKAAPAGAKFPNPRGVYSCQPYTASPLVRGMGTIGAVFLVLNVLLFFYSIIAEKNTVVLNENITSAQYKQEYVTQPFEVPHDGTVLRVRGSAPLDNSWIALDYAVVNTDEQVISEFYDEASYYHGRDSEGYWTEGSRSFSAYFKVEKAGNYRLLVHAAGGTGIAGGARDEPISLTVTADNTVSWYFIIPMALAACIAVSGGILRWTFEARRWAPVTEDDD
ncbi:MAG: DUF4178 domain-containing protein [Desulfomonilaceae bacterium]|nr:DUF4178 domain-containing protein [Desulfomonilaceae bacterium]